MKKFSITLLGTAVVAAASLFFWSGFTPEAQATGLLRSNEQYMVLPMANDNTGPGRLQAALNRLAADGWKVRAGLRWETNCIILAR